MIIKKVSIIRCASCIAIPKAIKKCPKCLKRYSKEYSAAHYKADKNYYKEKRRKWRLKNPIKDNEASRRYRLKNKEYYLMLTKAQRKRRGHLHRLVQNSWNRRKKYGEMAEVLPILQELETLIISLPEFDSVPEVKKRKQDRSYHAQRKSTNQRVLKGRALGYPSSSKSKRDRS